MSKYCIEYMNQENDTIIWGPFYSLDRAYKKADMMIDKQLKFRADLHRKKGVIYNSDGLFVASYNVRYLK